MYPYVLLQSKNVYGGSFIYHLGEETPLVALGFVVSYQDYITAMCKL